MNLWSRIFSADHQVMERTRSGDIPQEYPADQPAILEEGLPKYALPGSGIRNFFGTFNRCPQHHEGEPLQIHGVGPGKDL